MTTPPLYTPAEALARETFLALMWSLSYPGRVHNLPAQVPPFAAISETLLDLETSFFTNEPSLRETLARHGARALDAASAAYHFYPVLTDADRDALQQASIGTLLYPDRAATLIIGCWLEQGETCTVTGPGIDGSISMRIGGIPSAFWTIREQRRRYPLGWDVLFVQGSRVIGLPRSTTIT
jgi:alpha-D-ribose 1-methylphosphonate 5-triphosphate synthase subunit PhnH